MTTPDAEPPAPLSTADWAEANSRRWASKADQLDAQLEPLLAPLFERADLRPGESVIDVGCGCGATTRRAATLVGASGHVTGLDVSSQLLEDAAQVPCPDGAALISWILGDAQRHPLDAGVHDALISRFGVMFFDDPIEAFANLRSTMRSTGRLAMVVWQPRDASEILDRPLRVASRVAAEHGVTIDLGNPDAGPASFGVPSVMEGVLVGAGWTGVRQERVALPMYCGGPGTVADAVEIGLAVGPLSRALVGSAEGVTEAVRDALIADLEPLHDGVGVVMEAAVVFVTASVS